ncbi:MAG TPA: hypothetical protein VN840_04735 [Streptosporangiaceae bacterium]|nr:hypothetical protein [Streptosporangiaceae bacterium]
MGDKRRPRRPRSVKKIIRAALHEMALGFAQAGLSMSVLPPDMGWYFRRDDGDQLERLRESCDWHARQAAGAGVHARKARHG